MIVSCPICSRRNNIVNDARGVNCKRCGAYVYIMTKVDKRYVCAENEAVELKETNNEDKVQFQELPIAVGSKEIAIQNAPHRDRPWRSDAGMRHKRRDSEQVSKEDSCLF